MMETATEYQVEAGKKKKPKPPKPKPYYGYIELENGSKLQIKEKAKGRHLYRSLDKGYKGNTTAGLFSQLCCLDDKPLTVDQVDELESGLSKAIKDAVMDETFIKPIDVSQYPMQYEMITNDEVKKVELVEERKVRHDNEALKLAFNDVSRVGFWLITMLITINGEHLNLEDVKKLPASEVEELVMLMPLKKYTFTLTT